MLRLPDSVEPRCDNCTNWQTNDPGTTSAVCAIHRVTTQCASTCDDWECYFSEAARPSGRIKYPIDTILGQLGIAVMGSAIFEYGIKRAVDAFSTVSKKLDESEDKTQTLVFVYENISKQWKLSREEKSELLGFIIGSEIENYNLYEIIELSRDVKDRIVAAVEIDCYLTFLLVDEPVAKRRWLETKQLVFDGLAPIQCLQHFGDLYRVRNVLRDIVTGSRQLP
jgi:hypothetical protein